MCTLWSNTNTNTNRITTNRVKCPNTYGLIIVVYHPVFNFFLSYFFIQRFERWLKNLEFVTRLEEILRCGWIRVQFRWDSNLVWRGHGNIRYPPATISLLATQFVAVPLMVKEKLSKFEVTRTGRQSKQRYHFLFGVMLIRILIKDHPSLVLRNPSELESCEWMIRDPTVESRVSCLIILKKC